MRLLISFLIVVMFGCKEAQPPLPHSMKGYELYSWEKDGKWNFTLITGTNRNKTYEEIVATENVEAGSMVKISAVGVEELKKMLTRLPSGQTVTWVSRIKGFGWPPLLVIKEVTAHCKARNLILQRT